MTLSRLKFAMTPAIIVPALTLMLAGPQIAAAQSSGPSAGVPASELYLCEGAAGAEAQLVCFLTLTNRSRAANVSGAPLVFPDAAPRQTLDAEKGQLALERERLEVEKKRVAAESKRLAALEKKEKKKKAAKINTADIPKIQTLPIGRTAAIGTDLTRFYMENGEVWEQTQPGRVRLGRAEPDVLVIRKRSLGSFSARVNDKGTAIRVKRRK